MIEDFYVCVFEGVKNINIIDAVLNVWWILLVSIDEKDIFINNHFFRSVNLNNSIYLIQNILFMWNDFSLNNFYKEMLLY